MHKYDHAPASLLEHPEAYPDDMPWELVPWIPKLKKRQKKSKPLAKTVMTGFCPFCFERIQSDQPGGKNPRHLDDTPYGFCFSSY